MCTPMLFTYVHTNVVQGYSGVTTYVHKRFSPTAAESDSLGSSAVTEDFFDEKPDLDREGR